MLHAASIPTISTGHGPAKRRQAPRNPLMLMLLLEALLALVLLLLIVWWTMFSGRRKGELKPDDGES
jgi:hypothetical protein